MKLRRSELNSRVLVNLKEKEKALGGKCYTIWKFTNPKGEEYIFGRIKGTIVTLAYFEPLIRKYLPQWMLSTD